MPFGASSPPVSLDWGNSPVLGTELKARHVRPFLASADPQQTCLLEEVPVGRERCRADGRPHGTGHSGSSERAPKQPSLSSAAPHPHACLSNGLSWARGTAVISIQRAQGGAGSILGSGHQALRSCRGSRLQPWPEGALGAGQSRAFQVASGAQDRRCCCQQGPPLDFSHGEILRLQGNKVPCTWMDGGG